MIRSIGLVLAGGIAGAAIALLTAPQSGRRTRRLIVRKGEEIADRAAETGEELAERGRKALDESREFIHDKTGEARRKLASVSS